MSLHPSLKRVNSRGSSRTVLKKDEKIKRMIQEGKWDEDSKVFGLPKIKIVKMKVVKRSEEHTSELQSH